MGTTGILTRIPEEPRQASHNIAHMPKIQGQSLVAEPEISVTIRYEICGEKHLQMRTILIQKVGLNHRKFLWCTCIAL